MSKSSTHAYSRYAQEAMGLLGRTIRQARIEHRLTTQELATRAGISRTLLQRIEKGNSGCGIGVVFETAAIVGVPLFEDDRKELTGRVVLAEEKLALLPKSIRKPRKVVKDDF